MNKKTIGVVGSVAAAIIMAATPAFEWSGKETTTYTDIVGKSTVCAGHTGKYAVKGKTYTHDQCMAIFDEDMAAHAAEALKLSPWLAGNPYFLAVASDFTFHYGSGRWKSSSMNELGSAGDFKTMCTRFSMKSNGNPQWSFITDKNGKSIYVPGLNKRAKWRTEACRKGL